MHIEDELSARIRTLEEALLDPAIRQSAERIVSLLSGDFFEFGSSGHIYRYRQGDTFPPINGYEMTEFSITEMSPDCALATYRIVLNPGEGAKSSLRSTVWKLIGDQWKAVFHQSTPL
jgi:hypothetical protein